MKKHLAIFLTLVSCSITFIGQTTATWKWGKYGRSSFGGGTAVICDRSLNPIIVGYTTGGGFIVFENDTIFTQGGLSGAFVVKYNSLGKVLWAKNFDGNSSDHAWDVTTDKSKNIYIVGDYGTPYTVFDSDTLFCSAGSTSFLLKLDSLGKVKWVKRIDNSLNSICTDKYDNIYLAGSFSGPTYSIGTLTISNTFAGTTNAFTAKFDSNGNVIWLKGFGGTDQETNVSLTTDKYSNVYVSGFFSSSSFTFGPNTLVNSNTSYEDVFMVKYNSTGNEMWAKSYGSNLNERAYRIVADSVGNTYMTGNFYSPNLTLGTYSLTNQGKSDAYILKSDLNGNVIWSIQVSGKQDDCVNSLSLDPKGFVYANCRFGYPSLDTMQFGSTLIYPPANSLDPSAVLKIDSMGGLLCYNTLPTGGLLSGHNATDPDGNSYLTSGANKSPFYIANDTLNGNLGPFIFTAKWNCGVYSGIPDMIEKRKDPYVFPIPNNGTFYLLLPDEETENTELILFNSIGQIVHQQKIHKNNELISLSNLTNGVYYYNISKNNQIHKSGKLAIIK